ncbi:MAG: FAD/NAD(P)-binding protein [Candidatus Helarchaeota archaeon]
MNVNLEQNSKTQSENPYLPKLTTITKIIQENDINDLKTFRLEFQNPEDAKKYNHIPGQFGELTVFGFGECPIGIASSPTDGDYIEFTVKKVGVVTTALHEMKEGEIIGLRGPFGNGWPLESLKGSHILIIGGGFAFTTLRALIRYMLHPDNRKDFGEIAVLYGARNSGEMIYKYDLEEWQKRDDIKIDLTIDVGEDTWKYNVGYVPSICKDVTLKKTHPTCEDTVALVCGPPIMIKFTIPVLKEFGFNDDDILLSLENRMKCGIGKCGHCMVGEKYVCTDGPVFTQAQLQKMPKEY